MTIAELLICVFFFFSRNKVKDPLILFTICNLRKVLEEWIPKLHAAMKSCNELSRTSSETSLAGFLDHDALDNVSHLARMCFDTAVYGNSESLQELTCNENTDSKKHPDSLGVVHDCGLSADHDDLSCCKSSCQSVSRTSRGVLEHDVIDSVHTPQNAILPEDVPNCSCGALDHGAAKRELFALVGISQSEIPTEAAQSEIVWHESTAKELSTAMNIVPVTQATQPASPTEDSTVVGAKGYMACDTFSEGIGDCGKPVRQPAIGDGDHQAFAQGVDDSFCGEEITSRVQESYACEGASGSSISSCQQRNQLNDSSGISKQNISSSLEPLLDYELECQLCQTEYSFLHRHESETDVAISDLKTHQENYFDMARSMFLSCYFFLLNVEQVRRTLYMSKGDRRRTWKTLLKCLQGLILYFTSLVTMKCLSSTMKAFFHSMSIL